MHKVIGVGETVLDIIFRDGQPETAAPGGSTFNSMVSLGRAGIPSCFISEVGNNRPGSIILDFMKENNVSSDYVNVLPVKQPVSMAFLNEKNDAEYSFYRDAMDVHPDFRYPEIEPDDVVLYGSFFALNPIIRHQVKAFLEYAKGHGAILYYDVNFRPAHAKDLGEVGAAIEENFAFADIVRGSMEDFVTLYGMDDPERVYEEKIRPVCRNFIFTRAADPVEAFSGSFRKSWPVKPVKTVSTIGAGDNFNAGFICRLIRDGVTKKQLGSEGLSAEEWDRLVTTAQAFSADCCTSRFNYITPEFAKSLQQNIFDIA